MADFKGLTQETFAAYAPEKWSSNVHNLPRMRNKENLLALCDQAQKDLEEELAGLVRAASDEIPNITNHKKVDAQWVFWFRDTEARAALASFLEKTPLKQETIFNLAAQDKHAALVVVVRQQELWVGVRLAPGAVVDRRNLAAKLEKSWDREQLAELLAELPEGASIGPEDATVATAEVDLSTLELHARRLSEHDPAWIVGHRIAAEDAVELGEDLPDYLSRWLGALTPFYRYAAWTRDNDLIDAQKKIQQDKAEKRRNATTYNPGDRVRITSGLFTGKLGEVLGIDTKAQVRVRVGKMSVVVPGTDLTPAP